MANVADRFNKLKQAIVGTKTSTIDSKLDSTIKDISIYRSQSGSNGYIELVRNVISKAGISNQGLGSGSNLFSNQDTSPASFGQGKRLQRYKTYESIVSNISYCKRALDVLVGNILSPDDINKRSLEIKSESYLEDSDRSNKRVNKISTINRKLKIDDNLNNVVKNTLEYGDYFCEIADSKTALTSKSILSENSFYESLLEDNTTSKEIIYNDSESKLKVTLSYSSFVESKNQPNNKNNTDSDNTTNSGKDLNNLNLVFHEPNRIVKLQSELFPLCFGYLVFPKQSFMNLYGNPQEQAVNDICTSILKSLQSKVPQAEEFNNDEELKDIISAMIKESGGTQVMNIRYVPPDKMVHFMVPSTKYYPYGESIFDACQFNAKVLMSLTTALAIQRLSRSTEKRKIGVEIGLPKDASKQVQKLKEEFRKRKISLDSFGTVDTIPCLDLDTEIRMLNGFPMKLRDIITEFNNGNNELWVYSYDFDTGKVFPNKIKNARVTGRNVNVVKVTLDNGESIICTPEHRWLLRDGTYKEAKDLQENDSLMPLYRRSAGYNSEFYTYEEVYHPGNDDTYGKWQLTHRMVSEYLNIVNENRNTCHHIDKNVRNNHPLNLEGLTCAEHIGKHINECIESRKDGKDKIKVIETCKYCGSEFETYYFPRRKTCGNPSCINESKKSGGLNSWEQRKHVSKYKKVTYNCEWCGQEIEISKSILDNKILNNNSILCSESCKNRMVQYKELNKKYLYIDYINCDVCGNFCVHNSEYKLKLKVCSNKCSQTLLSRRRWESNRITVSCDWCGKEFESPRGRFKENKYNACYDKNCINEVRKLNKYLSMNKRKSDEIYFINCKMCDSLLTVSDNNQFKDRNRAKSNNFCNITCSNNYRKFNNEVESTVQLNHKVKSVEFLDEKIDVGDIEVEKHHNFALEAGVFIHNSMISTFEDIYIPQKDGKPYVDIETMDQGNVDTRSKVEELEYLRSSVVACLGVPNAFINIEEELSNKCLDLFTIIPLASGKKPQLIDLIKEYEETGEIKDKYTYSYDNETGKIVAGKITWAGKTRLNTKVVKVTLGNGEYDICTPDHYWMLRDGTYKQAEYLDENDLLMSSNNEPVAVLSIEFLEEKVDTGDITVEKYHNFSIGSGVIVHNSVLSEENVLFARTIVNHQKYLNPQINELFEKILRMHDPEEGLLALESVSISLPSPRSLQYERESRYMGEIVTLIENLERIGIPKDYAKKKYLPQIDWKEVENWESHESIEKSLGSDEEEEEEGFGGEF